LCPFRIDAVVMRALAGRCDSAQEFADWKRESPEVRRDPALSSNMSKTRTQLAIAGAALVLVTVAAAYWVHMRLTQRLPVAASSPGGKPLRAAILSATPKGSRPDLWVLSVGVSHYKESGIELRFADADARAVAEELQAQEHLPLYGNVHGVVLTN